MEQLQSHNVYDEGLPYIHLYEEMLKYLIIYEEAVNHIWLCNWAILNFLTYEESLIFLYQCSQATCPFALQLGVLFITEFQILFHSESPARHGTSSHLHSARLFSIFNVTKFTHIYTTSPQNTQLEEKII